MSRTSSSRMPELPRAAQLARMSMVARITSGGAIGPTPTRRKRSRLRCRSAVFSALICRPLLSPNPVVTP